MGTCGGKDSDMLKVSGLTAEEQKACSQVNEILVKFPNITSTFLEGLSEMNNVRSSEMQQQAKPDGEGNGENDPNQHQDPNENTKGVSKYISNMLIDNMRKELDETKSKLAIESSKVKLKDELLKEALEKVDKSAVEHKLMQEQFKNMKETIMAKDVQIKCLEGFCLNVDIFNMADIPDEVEYLFNEIKDVTIPCENGQYTGQSLKGKPFGEGKYQYSSGNLFTGNYVGGLRHGKGTFYDRKDGFKREGEFRFDKQIGLAVDTYNNNNRTDYTVWVDGEGQVMAKRVYRDEQVDEYVNIKDNQVDGDRIIYNKVDNYFIVEMYESGRQIGESMNYIYQPPQKK